MKILIVEDEFIVANDLANILRKASYQINGLAGSYDDALSMIQNQKPDMVLLDIRLKGTLTGIDLANKLVTLDVPFIYLSANSNKSTLEKAKLTKPYGFLVKPFREKDLLVALEIASYHHAHREKMKEDFKKKTFETPEQVSINFQKLQTDLMEFAIFLQQKKAFDYLQIEEIVNDDITKYIGAARTGSQEYQIIGLEELSNLCGLEVEQIVSLQKNHKYDLYEKTYSEESFKYYSDNNKILRRLSKTLNLKEVHVFPLKLNGNLSILFSFFSKRTQVYSIDKLNDSNKLEKILLDKLNPFTMTDSKSTKDSTRAHDFRNIIGKHPSILKTFDQIRRVAPMETSVLITGESGTGKELIAKSIHQYSLRSNMPFIVLNCGTLPENLIESILFGHEKGAFTGAVEKRIGKFEQANGGTIFLDEIGEMPLDLQIKLLRVLQEREIERIGGTRPIKLNIRIIAATNRNLEEEVEAGKFRLDLYYRLQVFPISLPALRERREDIPLLINHFLKRKGEELGLIKTIHPQTLRRLTTYDWPGNIRELEHYIEKSILLSDGQQITEIYPIGFNTVQKSFKLDSKEKTINKVKTIDENEREHILNILLKCKGKIFGPGGAAEILRIHSSTLNSKIKKLGIKKEDIFGATNQ